MGIQNIATNSWSEGCQKVVSKSVSLKRFNDMKKSGQLGFSLVELLLVVVIIGVIAAMAVPAYQKGMWAAENGSAFGTMRTIASTQVAFFAQNNRFGRLDEINSRVGGGIGTVVGDNLVRGRYVYSMSPSSPTDAELRTEYLITAKREVTGDTLYQFELDQSGRITQVYPVGAPQN
jgi:prepilin-type N-terminal cleavage/methylation domain-containing protein